MRITVRNLGVLKEAEIDLKPLTVFIGPNNSGKTWLAYTLGSIFGPYGLNEYLQAYNKEQVPTFDVLKDTVDKVLIKGSSTLNLYNFAKKDGELYFNEVARLTRNWINEFLGTQHTDFDHLDVVLDFAKDKEQFLQQVRQFSYRSNIAKGLLTIQKRRGESKVYAYTTTEEQEEKIGEDIPQEEVKKRLVGFVLAALHRSLYPHVRVFPTERTTFAASRFSERIAADNEQIQNIAKLRESLNKLIKDFNITEFPVDDEVVSGDVTGPTNAFLDMLRDIFRIGVKAREARLNHKEGNSKIGHYIDFADVLEEKILAGNIEFSTPEPDSSREILFHPSQGVNLEISLASSMVKELSSLVLYLRLLAQPNELLIIDEPEMNLHPEAQAKMIEFLAMLVNAGLNVLFTTHSPYITDHLTNLIKASESEDKEAIKDNFFLKRTDAFIAKDKVSVYGFGEGTVRNALDEEGFINLNTFGEVSERISNIYFAL